jgi:hypothetical protein
MTSIFHNSAAAPTPATKPWLMHTPEPIPPTPGPPPPEMPPQPMPEPSMPPIVDPIPPEVGEPIRDPGTPAPEQVHRGRLQRAAAPKRQALRPDVRR